MERRLSRSVPGGVAKRLVHDIRHGAQPSRGAILAVHDKPGIRRHRIGARVKAAGQQDLGEAFGSGTLLANGPTLEGLHGFCNYDFVDAGAIEEFLKDDPVLTSGVLELASVTPRTLLIDSLGADSGDNMLFVLNYRSGKGGRKSAAGRPSGPSWRSGARWHSAPVIREWGLPLSSDAEVQASRPAGQAAAFAKSFEVTGCIHPARETAASSIKAPARRSAVRRRNPAPC